MDTFSPVRNPDSDASKSVQPRIIEANFGNGYTVRAGDGLNTKPVTWTLSWSVLTSAEADYIDGFLDDKAGYIAFLYTVPGDTERQYTCKEWSRMPGEVLEKVSAKFVQNFDIP